MTDRHGYQFRGRVRTLALRMYWETVEGRLVCRWIDCGQPFERAEPNDIFRRDCFTIPVTGYVQPRGHLTSKYHFRVVRRSRIDR